MAGAQPPQLVGHRGPVAPGDGPIEVHLAVRIERADPRHQRVRLAGRTLRIEHRQGVAQHRAAVGEASDQRA